MPKAVSRASLDETCSQSSSATFFAYLDELADNNAVLAAPIRKYTDRALYPAFDPEFVVR